MTDIVHGRDVVEVAHGKWAQQVGVSPALLEYLVSHGLVASLRKQGRTYLLDARTTPGAEEIVAVARAEYRRLLKVTIGAVERLAAEVDAVRLDALDALEHGTDPVTALGTDLATIPDTQRGYGVDAARADLRHTTLSVSVLHRYLYEHDQAARIAALEGTATLND